MPPRYLLTCMAHKVFKFNFSKTELETHLTFSIRNALLFPSSFEVNGMTTNMNFKARNLWLLLDLSDKINLIFEVNIWFWGAYKSFQPIFTFIMITKLVRGPYRLFVSRRIFERHLLKEFQPHSIQSTHYIKAQMITLQFTWLCHFMCWSSLIISLSSETYIHIVLRVVQRMEDF